MPRSSEKPDREAVPPAAEPRAMDAEDATAAAAIRAHLQASLGSIEAAVGALGFGGGSPASLDRERWRRVSALLQQALGAIEAAREVCGSQVARADESSDP